VLAALAGVVAAAVALGTAELVAAFIGPRSAPLIAVDAAVVDAVPGPVKEFAIRTFGTGDKAALLTGTAVLLILYAAACGLLARRNLRLGLIAVALFGLVGTAAALTRPGANVAWAVPSLLGTAAAVVILAYMIRLLPAVPAPDRAPAKPPSPPEPEPAPAEPEDAEGEAPAGPEPGARIPAGMRADWAAAREADRPVPVNRRRLLVTGAVAIGGSAVAGYLGHLLGQRSDVAATRASIVLPTPSSAVPPPAGAELDVPELARFVTSNADFYRIDTALVAPGVDAKTWRLRLHGRVRRELTLTYDQLLARPMIERYVTLCCVSNEIGGDLIGTAKWLGVPLKDLLDEVEPAADAGQLVGRSSDGWTCGTPTAVCRDGRDAMLAVGMNGEPLPVEHGFPVRMVVPGLYGYVSATKWLVDLELSRFADFDAYWIRRGWSREAPIKTQARIDTPRQGADRRPGPVTVAGVAWAQHRGITKVEVQVDDGPWRVAELAEVPSVDTWRQWRVQWDATSGDHTLRVRATDGDGQVQTSHQAPPPPDGATGWHTVTVTVK